MHPDIMHGGFNWMGVHTECEGDTDRKFHTGNSEERYLWPKTVSEVIPECNFIFCGGSMPQVPMHAF